jgi:hypothetical protein
MDAKKTHIHRSACLAAKDCGGSANPKLEKSMPLEFSMDLNQLWCFAILLSIMFVVW